MGMKAIAMPAVSNLDETALDGSRENRMVSLLPQLASGRKPELRNIDGRLYPIVSWSGRWLLALVGLI